MTGEVWKNDLLNGYIFQKIFKRFLKPLAAEGEKLIQSRTCKPASATLVETLPLTELAKI